MENREDIPRVSVGSVQDWKKVRSNYEEAALSKLQEQAVLRDIEDEKDAILAHLAQVGFPSVLLKCILGN
jgi:hypothetical protein